MARIRVAVTGDEWCNRDEVLAGIAANTGDQELILEVNTEGPSLHALGIVQTVSAALAEAGISDQNVYVDQWHNPVEQIPWKRWRDVGLSHFFWMSDRYRHQEPDAPQDFRVFGLFVGRLTAARAVMLYDVCHDMRDKVLVSLMRNSYRVNTYETEIQDWLDQSQQQRLTTWLGQQPVVSLTNHEVRDQYRPEHNTNADLVRHYNRFAIEIIAETYCQGDAFFPTEKVIRPLAKKKPFVLYGPRNFLRHLRDLGFQTWHDVWDEGYDSLAGPDRWAAMKSTLHYIMDNNLWSRPAVNSICQANLDRLESLIKKHEPL